VAGELVLIVDDNARNVKLARDVLEAAGFRTLAASSGGEAISLAGRHLPDVILMDIRLPDVDGIESMRRLRGDPLTRGIPVVALTALAPGDPDWFVRAGFDGHLEKPIEVSEFPEQVRSHCRRASSA
jgi:two-component system cell cycle response regulator DivK